MKKSHCLAAVSSLVLVASFQLAKGQGAPTASSGGGHCVTAAEHCIKVTVQGNTISVNVPEQHIKASGTGRHWIVWHIDTPGYAFSVDSRDPPIVFEADTKGQFDHTDARRCYPWKSPQQFCCIDASTQPGRFKYTIKLTGPTPVAPLDPFVVND